MLTFLRTFTVEEIEVVNLKQSPHRDDKLMDDMGNIGERNIKMKIQKMQLKMA